MWPKGITHLKEFLQFIFICYLIFGLTFEVFECPKVRTFKKVVIVSIGFCEEKKKTITLIFPLLSQG